MRSPIFSIVVLVLLSEMTLRSEMHGAPRREALCACAAFAPDGSFLAATVDGTSALVEFTEATGKMAYLSLPLQYVASAEQLGYSVYGQLYSCEIRFSKSGDLAAIGIRSGLKYDVRTAQLQVAVAEIKSLKWIANWEIERDAQIVLPVMAGFIEGTKEIVVAGETPADKHRRLSWRTAHHWVIRR